VRKNDEPGTLWAAAFASLRFIPTRDTLPRIR
jgi:hypothetical protein